MRLICPNCGAQYDVDGSLIPEAGRDVQCSNCGHSWFQRPEDFDLELEDALESDPAKAPASPETAPDAPAETPPETPASPKPRSLDPAVADVLREEAERETKARREETTGGLESQPDLGLDEAEEDRAVTATRSAAARARMARLRGQEDEPEGDSGPRSGLLPDVDEINSTLRGQEDREATAEPEIATEEEKKRTGFRVGFFAVMGLCIVLVLVYSFAPLIVRSVPQSETVLSIYVDGVNKARITVNGTVEDLAAKLRDFSGSFGTGGEE
ncbi:zinc-ribbon domain-containing protein [Pseudoruegeria sp. HB172150]|uniref:zinc-ribbon domain-containing protein n=1 Tax=Pseudoruegeria sp. HB172150 TaxID=2721164 RepID=UPI001556D767|nr:zinc-ribbon domain-containing protein [Pseudoruegeria sp. HB172150]